MIKEQKKHPDRQRLMCGLRIPRVTHGSSQTILFLSDKEANEEAISCFSCSTSHTPCGFYGVD